MRLAGSLTALINKATTAELNPRRGGGSEFTQISPNVPTSTSFRDYCMHHAQFVKEMNIMSIKSQLPRILCLHGAGSSGNIFRAQGRKIFQSLRHEFQFVFVDAPFPSTAGPGMYPTYADSGPFFRWQCDLSASSSFDITEEEVLAETEKVWQSLEAQLCSPGGGPFVGVMAFSQGARVATGLLLHLEKKRDQHCSGLPKIKFIIVNSATYPPLLFESESDLGDALDASLDRNSFKKVSISSIHIEGSNDPWNPESVKMREEYFDQQLSTVIPFVGGHQVPVTDKDADEITVAIRKVAAQASVL
jgi:predicted esterase